MATARFLAQQSPNGTAFVIGEGGLLTALHHNGYAMVDHDPDYRGGWRGPHDESGDDGDRRADDPRRGEADRHEPRPQLPDGRTACVPVAGPWWPCSETATGLKAFSVGKPSPVMMRTARKELGLATDETTMIGDTMETDILGGVQLGYPTVLVLSGGTKPEDLVQLRLSTRSGGRFGRRAMRSGFL